MTREWILQTLEELRVWCWPIFLWDLMRIRAWLNANPNETEEILMFEVLSNGRIIMTNHLKADRPDPADWAHYAPRAPWEKLAVDACLMIWGVPAACEDSTDRVTSVFPLANLCVAQPFFDTG
ncbi:hypothetical protein [Henriciella litoralis]|uniref:hypothetical protein n=1 Tax=Henriciella litoralis TaxID=568102 RepID=UPI0009FD69A1|nr:hypothetical protein [Henriciella litoralis]